MSRPFGRGRDHRHTSTATKYQTSSSTTASHCARFTTSHTTLILTQKTTFKPRTKTVFYAPFISVQCHQFITGHYKNVSRAQHGKVHDCKRPWYPTFDWAQRWKQVMSLKSLVLKRSLHFFLLCLIVQILWHVLMAEFWSFKYFFKLNSTQLNSWSLIRFTGAEWSRLR